VLTHRDVWIGIDRLAARNGLSASGLAKRAGLDPTTFNKSKRTTKQGKARWPSTESLAKILEATGTNMAEFVQMMQGDGTALHPEPRQRLRCASLRSLEQQPMFDPAGFPTGDLWEEVDFPQIEDPQAYVVEVDRDLQGSAYRPGDMLVLSPSSSIRRHDRVLMRSTSGALRVCRFVRRTATRVVVEPAGGGPEESLPVGEVDWLARIVWVSQ
jgi:phage repressor protein C with HTH and peptisase S24 domain